MDVQLEHADEVPDPRVMLAVGSVGFEGNFRLSVNGRTLTITRNGGWRRPFELRVYMPPEEIPDFTSTVYTYWGLRDERAPEDTTEIIFHPSVRTIREYAFNDCDSLVRVKIPDTVTHIGKCAFGFCVSLRYILLSRNLERIGECAFWNCSSLQALFLPQTVTHIGNEAFCDCASLRFVHVPDTIEQFGNGVFEECDRLSTRLKNNGDDNDLSMHKVCYNTSINRETIQECIATHGIERATEADNQQMTALHILCANPHVTADCILAYLQLAPEAADQQDSEGMTPFHYLCGNDITGDAFRAYLELVPDTTVIRNNAELTGLHILCSLPKKEVSTGDAIRAYLQLTPEAADQQDSEGMTPFQYLCRNDDVTFLDDRNFSSLIAWWYGCMP